MSTTNDPESVQWPLADLARLIQQIPEVAQRARSGGITPDSPHGLQLSQSDDFDRRQLTNIVYMSGLRLTVAEDHLGAIGELVLGGKAIYATYTLARTAAELCARVWFALDPEMDGKDRVRVCISERLFSFSEVARLGFDDAARHVHHRATELIIGAENNGYARLRDRDGRPIRRFGVPQMAGRCTSITDLMKDMLGDDFAWVYGYLSAFAHGTNYAITQLLRPTGIDAAEGGVTWTRVGTTAGEELNVISLAVLAYREAMARHRELSGWTSPEFGHLLQSIWQEIRRLDQVAR